MEDDFRLTREIKKGLSRRDLENRQIHVFTLENHHRPAIDALFDSILHLQKKQANPFLMVIDLSESPRIALMPYIHQRSQEAALQAPPDSSGRLAVVAPKLLSLLLQPIQGYVLRDLQKKMPQIEVALFGDLEKALAWLRELIRHPANNPATPPDDGERFQNQTHES